MIGCGSAGSTKVKSNKMITEVLLVLPLYLALFHLWLRFQHVIKMMTDVESILNHDEFFADPVDAVSKDKVLGGKKQWTHEKVDTAGDETINKAYAEYKQRELNEKGEKTGIALGKDIISLHSTGISQIVKIRDVKKIQQDIENDPIIKDQMA